MRYIQFVMALAALVCLSAAPADRPNILFAIADDASYPHMGAYGTGWVETPAFDRVAAEGILFTRAYTPNGKCAPSRSCVLTGRNPWQLETAVNHMAPFPAQFMTYAEALAGAGYFVGKTGKGWGPGDPGMRDGKPRQLAGTPFDRRRAEPPTSKMGATDYAGNFEDFLAANGEGKPWCFWYGAVEPHRAYEYGSGVAKGGKALDSIDSVPGMWPDDEVTRNDLLDYAFEIEHFDRHLGRMLALLESRGELENTLVVVTADNGMPFPRVKGQVYGPSNHMPLAIMWQGGIAAPGRVEEALVNFIDFAPTFLAAAGVDAGASGMAPMTGRSLLPIFRGEAGGADWRNHVLLGKERHDVGRPGDAGYPVRALLEGDLLYIHNFEPDRWPSGNPETGYLNCDGGATKTRILEMRRAGRDGPYWRLCFGKRPAEELYDVRKDPWCLENLMADPGYEARAGEMRGLLFGALAAEGDRRVAGDAGWFDGIPYTDARTAGFYERYMGGEALKAGWVEEGDFEAGMLD
ncbi:MAG: sulfatase [Candidatus Hydrogenedentes bacterium]|nr:sulfatase [Candidatus Hydrogenedentota bacterium]